MYFNRAFLFRKKNTGKAISSLEVDKTQCTHLYRSIVTKNIRMQIEKLL